MDEKEYRIVLINKSENNEQYLFAPIDGALMFIILGDRFNKVHQNRIMEFGERYSARAFVLKYGRLPYLSELK